MPVGVRGRDGECNGYELVDAGDGDSFMGRRGHWTRVWRVDFVEGKVGKGHGLVDCWDLFDAVERLWGGQFCRGTGSGGWVKRTALAAKHEYGSSPKATPQILHWRLFGSGITQEVALTQTGLQTEKGGLSVLKVESWGSARAAGNAARMRVRSSIFLWKTGIRFLQWF